MNILWRLLSNSYYLRRAVPVEVKLKRVNGLASQALIPGLEIQQFGLDL